MLGKRSREETEEKAAQVGGESPKRPRPLSIQRGKRCREEAKAPVGGKSPERPRLTCSRYPEISVLGDTASSDSEDKQPSPTTFYPRSPDPSVSRARLGDTTSDSEDDQGRHGSAQKKALFPKGCEGYEKTRSPEFEQDYDEARELIQKLVKASNTDDKDAKDKAGVNGRDESRMYLLPLCPCSHLPVHGNVDHHKCGKECKQKIKKREEKKRRLQEQAARKIQSVYRGFAVRFGFALSDAFYIYSTLFGTYTQGQKLAIRRQRSDFQIRWEPVQPFIRDALSLVRKAQNATLVKDILSRCVNQETLAEYKLNKSD